MKKLTAALIFCLCMLYGAAAKAEAGGYIIESDDNAPLMLMSTDENIVPLGERGHYFYAESMTDMAKYLPYAKNVCEDFEMELFGYPETTNDKYFSRQWNHPAMKAEALRSAGLDGSGVRVGIIDSGINIYHEDIDAKKIAYTYDCITGSEKFEAVNDSYGHGSFVAGTIAAVTNNGKGIAGLTPNVEFAIFKVTEQASFSASNFINAFERALNQNCDIINLSLGTAAEGLNTRQYNMLSSLVAGAYANDIIIVAAAGNNGSAALNYPAAFDTVIGVGSISPSYTRSDFSNYNESIFVTAPGESLYGPYCGGSSRYTGWKGTSFSVPEVAAAAAAAKQVWKDMTTDEFKWLLIDASTDMGAAGYDVHYGFGLLNYEKITEKLLSDSSPPEVSFIDPLEEYSSKAVIEKYISDNKLRIKLIPKSNADLSGIKLYVNRYSSDGRLSDIKEYSGFKDRSGLEFTADIPEEGNYKIMLLDNNCIPVTMPIPNE